MSSITTTPAPAAVAKSPGARLGSFMQSSRVPGFLLLVCLLLLWEASARFGWVTGRAWPPFSVVLQATYDGIANGELLSVFGPSLYRLFLGFIIGTAAGLVIGLAAGIWAPFSWALTPSIEVLRVLPAPAIVPTLILFLGVDDTLKVTVIALAAFFPIYVNTINGLRGASNVLVDTARTFRLSPVKTLWAVTIPAILPSVASGVRIAIGGCFVATVMAEMISGSSGIGYFITQTQYALRPEAMYTAVIGLGVVGYTLNLTFIAAERRFLSWYGVS